MSGPVSVPRLIAPALGAALLLAAGLSLGGCGKQGTLDQPAPLFGEKAKAAYRAQKAKEAAAAKKGSSVPVGDPNAPPAPAGSQPDPGLEPLRSSPPPGQEPSPFASPPPGVLPDPFAHPDSPGTR